MGSLQSHLSFLSEVINGGGRLLIKKKSSGFYAESQFRRSKATGCP